MGTCGNFDFELMTKDIAKFSIGNIPEIKDISNATLINHLVENGYSKSFAKKEIQNFNLFIEQSFWKEVVESCRQVSENGAYMHILGLGLRVVFPVFTSPVGDDPALKRQCLIYEGHTNHPCINCEYPLRAGVFYDSNIHKHRNAAEIISNCQHADDAIKKMNNNNRKLSKPSKSIIEKLQQKSIHPMCNAFHQDNVLGIGSSIYDVTSDSFHVFLAGIMKSGTIAICTIVDTIHNGSNNGVLDARLNQFWAVPHMKYLSWTKFKRGLSELATKKSKSDIQPFTMENLYEGQGLC
jgi:hypothetical protein